MQAKRRKRTARKQRLQELTVRKARAESKTYLIWDSGQPHLALQVQPTGSKSFKVIYSRHGRPRWYHIGDAAVIGLADARTMAAEVMLAVAKGADPAANKKAERSSGTFADLHEKYLEQYAKKNNKSWRQADALIRRNVLPRWGKLRSTDINHTDVESMMARIKAPITANQTLAATSAVFIWAVKKRILTDNPCRLIDRNPTKDRERVLAESEVRPFWQALDAVDPVEAAALRVVLLTGQRPGEVAHMRCEHIRDGWWEMPGEPVPTLGWPGTKNGKPHRVWLPQAAQDLIGGGDTGFVFAGARGSPTSGLDGVMREISRKLGGEPVRPHDLRRTHGSTITALGFGRDAMNRIQNHKEGGIADVYDRHGYETETKRIMEAVASHITALVEGVKSTNIVRPEFGGQR
jgi:integrase